jgi:hypothetical protein
MTGGWSFKTGAGRGRCPRPAFSGILRGGAALVGILRGRILSFGCILSPLADVRGVGPKVAFSGFLGVGAFLIGGF